jgi:hypothetical protein
LHLIEENDAEQRIVSTRFAIFSASGRNDSSPAIAAFGSTTLFYQP